MQNRNARRPWTSIWAACALLTLQGCASERIVYRDRLVEVPIPVRAPVEPALTADTPPAFDVPADGPLPFSVVLRRLSAVEDALLTCRSRLQAIREL